MIQYTRDDIIAVLQGYNEQVARRDMLCVEYWDLAAKLRSERRNIASTIALGAQQYDGMPHSSTPGNPTMQKAIRLADGNDPQYIRDLQDDVNQAQRKYRAADAVVRRVDAWLKALDHKELFAIQNQTIDGMTWAEVTAKYNRDYGIIYGKGVWIRSKRSGIEKIEKLCMTWI